MAKYSQTTFYAVRLVNFTLRADTGFVRNAFLSLCAADSVARKKQQLVATDSFTLLGKCASPHSRSSTIHFVVLRVFLHATRAISCRHETDGTEKRELLQTAETRMLAGTQQERKEDEIIFKKALYLTKTNWANGHQLCQKRHTNPPTLQQLRVALHKDAVLCVCPRSRLP